MDNVVLLPLPSIYPSFITQEKLDCILERRLLLLFCLKQVFLECLSTGAKGRLHEHSQDAFGHKVKRSKSGKVKFSFSGGDFFLSLPLVEAGCSSFGFLLCWQGVSPLGAYPERGPRLCCPSPAEIKGHAGPRYVTLPLARTSLLSLKHHWEAIQHSLNQIQVLLLHLISM